jgi:hypothetical protein
MSAQDSEVVAPVEEEVKVYQTFDSMDLPTDLLRAIFSHGFE